MLEDRGAGRSKGGDIGVGREVVVALPLEMEGTRRPWPYIFV